MREPVENFISVVMVGLGIFLVLYALRQVLARQGRGANRQAPSGSMAKWLIIALVCLLGMGISAVVVITSAPNASSRYLHYVGILSEIGLLVTLVGIDRLTTRGRVDSPTSSRQSNDEADPATTHEPPSQ